MSDVVWRFDGGPVNGEQVISGHGWPAPERVIAFSLDGKVSAIPEVPGVFGLDDFSETNAIVYCRDDTRTSKRAEALPHTILGATYVVA